MMILHKMLISLNHKILYLLNNKYYSTNLINKNNNNYILKELSLDINYISPTQKTLNKYSEIEYKLLDYLIYPKFNDNTLHWTINFKHLILHELEDDYTYSLAILGNSRMNRTLWTYGPHILVTNKINIDKYITYIEGQIDSSVLDQNSDYNPSKDLKIVFKYRKISIIKKVHDSVSSTDINNINNFNNKLLNIDNYYKEITKFLNIIPITWNLRNYGIILNNKFTYKIECSKKEIIIQGVLLKYKHNVNILIYDYNLFTYKGIVFKNNHEYFRFTDIIIDNNLNYKLINNYIDFIKDYKFIEGYNLIRIINDKIIYINNNKIQLIEKKLKGKLIEKDKRDFIYNKKIGTFDIECYKDKDDNFIPFACKWLIRNKSNKFYLTNYKDYEDMFEQCFIDIFNNCTNYIIYAHNLSSFDAILIIKVLYNNYKVKPFFKDNKIMNLLVSKKVELDNGKKVIKKFIFRCSLVLLPLSLIKLIKALNIDILKLSYPYDFVNEHNLEYKGTIPEYEYYKEQISYEEYQNICEEYKEWDLREETMKYLNNDVESLYKVLNKFIKDFYELERIDVTKSITISSLSLRTFLTNYYNPKNTPIFIPKYSVYKDIKKGYYGGRVEVFGTYAENIYWYDINSLYPYSMLSDMPTGLPIWSTDTNLDNYFGYCYVSVNIPSNIKNPIIPYRDKEGNIYTPVGNWDGWYNSELLKYARDQYNIEVIVHYGYKYKQTPDLFKEYVNKYYELKKKASLEGNEGFKFISKLMLNSLYGRFGLKYISTVTEIVTTQRALEISLEYKVIENSMFNKEKGLEYIKYNIAPNEPMIEINPEVYYNIKELGENDSENVIRSVGIAAMVTSQAMIYMDKFINLNNNKCYYTDTDSVFLDKPLDHNLVGTKLGKMKLVYIFDEAVYLAPKIYGGKIINKDLVKIKKD